MLYYLFSAHIIVIEHRSVTDSSYMCLALSGVKYSIGHDSQCYEWIIMFLFQFFSSGGVVLERTMLFTMAVKHRGLDPIKGFRKKK